MLELDYTICMIKYIHFDSIDSTNSWAKSHASTLDPNQLTCITALEQTGGRGRWSRKWVSPKGLNIYATLFFALPKNSSCIPNLGQVLSLSCCTVLKKNGFSPQIKWPNDLLLDGKKFSGILTEAVSLDDRIGIALGMGMNVNMPKELLDAIDQRATSLAEISGHAWTLEQILEPIVLQFREDLETLQKKGFSPFQEKYTELLAYKGKTISFFDGVAQRKGICHSITPEGQLKLQLPSGELITLSAGEITVSGN